MFWPHRTSRGPRCDGARAPRAWAACGVDARRELDGAPLLPRAATTASELLVRALNDKYGLVRSALGQG